jgi:hypothetical protein
MSVNLDSPVEEPRLQESQRRVQFFDRKADVSRPDADSGVICIKGNCQVRVCIDAWEIVNEKIE